MKIPPWLVPKRFRRKAVDLNTTTPIQAPYGFSSKWGWIGEVFAGSWQADLTLTKEEQLAFSAVFACVALRSRDIAKLCMEVRRKNQQTGTWQEAENSAFLPLMRRPNHYQTRFQFMQEWMTSKLGRGNTYVLKERDGRGMVSAMYVLNPDNVRPLVAPNGDVYYELGTNRLVGFPYQGVTLPASEIIHDRGPCLFHPLVGVSALFAAGSSATQGVKIQSNSRKFFGNMSRPSGHLTTDGRIDDQTATRLQKQFEEGFAQANLGRLLVSGSGLKFEPFQIPAEDAQLIEQLKWTAEDVCRAFLVPPYKIGLGSYPSLGDVSSLNQEYYQQALQPDMESIELLLDDGLSLPSDISIEFDLDDLLRMDPKTRAEVDQIELRAGIRAPNEARAKRNLAPVKGGESPYMQQQNYSLAALAKRDAKADPFASSGGAPSGGGSPPPAAPMPPAPPQQNEVDDAMLELKALLDFEKDILEVGA